jgi:hypothetical protein
MPTPTKLWSANALAAEFRLDRRTVTRRLRGVRPCGRRNGHPAWTLPVAARALLDDGEAHPRTRPRTGRCRCPGPGSCSTGSTTRSTAASRPRP